jgi:hypothetical protein
MTLTMETFRATDSHRPVVMILTPVYNEEANLSRYEDAFGPDGHRVPRSFY